MNVFGMGSMEIVIILVAALIIFGPARLPEMAGKVGKTIRDLRQMSSDLTSEFERTAGVQDLKKAVQGEITGVKSQVSSVTDSVKRDLNKAGSSVSSTVSSAKPGTGGKTSSSTSSVSSTKTTTKPAAKTGTASSTKTAPPAPPKATKKDPLADVSFLEEPAPPPAASIRPATSISTNGASAAPKPATVTSTDGADQIDALSRARQRRLAAGYNRRPGS